MRHSSVRLGGLAGLLGGLLGFQHLISTSADGGDRFLLLVGVLLRATCYRRSSLLEAVACVRGAGWFSSKPETQQR